MHDNHHLQSTVAYQNTGQTVLSRRATALLRLRRIRYQVHTKYIYIFMQMRAHHRYSCTWTCSWYYDFWSYTCTGTGSTIWLLCIARIVARCAVLSRCARQSALAVNLKSKNWVRTGRKHWWCTFGAFVPYIQWMVFGSNFMAWRTACEVATELRASVRASTLSPNKIRGLLKVVDLPKIYRGDFT